MSRPLPILFCSPQLPNNTGATMRLAAVRCVEKHTRRTSSRRSRRKMSILGWLEYAPPQGGQIPGALTGRCPL